MSTDNSLLAMFVKQLHHYMRTLPQLIAAAESFSIDSQAMFQCENLYVHEVPCEIAYKWLIVESISAPYLDGRIAQTWYNDDGIHVNIQE